MTVKMLLKSCATPAASWPTDSSFLSVPQLGFQVEHVRHVRPVTMDDLAGGDGKEGPDDRAPVDADLFAEFLAAVLRQSRARPLASGGRIVSNCFDPGIWPFPRCVVGVSQRAVAREFQDRIGIDPGKGGELLKFEFQPACVR